MHARVHRVHCTEPPETVSNKAIKMLTSALKKKLLENLILVKFETNSLFMFCIARLRISLAFDGWKRLLFLLWLTLLFFSWHIFLLGFVFSPVFMFEELCMLTEITKLWTYSSFACLVGCCTEIKCADPTRNSCMHGDIKWFRCVVYKREKSPIKKMQKRKPNGCWGKENKSKIVQGRSFVCVLTVFWAQY